MLWRISPSPKVSVRIKEILLYLKNYLLLVSRPPCYYCNVFLIVRVKILQDYSTSLELLSRDNINFPELQQYALDAAHFSTDLPELEFAVSYRVMSCDVSLL